MASFELFILCHNRPEMAELAINSALNQIDKDFTLIISDNSTTNDVYNLCISKYPKIKYVRRYLNNNLEHFKCCISEANSDYFCIFHDDDLLIKNFIEIAKHYADLYPSLVAFGYNSFLSINGDNVRRHFYNSHKTIYIINNVQTLINAYFNFSTFGYPAFPGYVYKKSVQTILYPSNGGKYSDFQWLVMLINLGNIGWINTPTFIYNLHGNNDSLRESMGDRLKILSFIKNSNMQFSSLDLNIYRIFLYNRLILCCNYKKITSYKKIYDKVKIHFVFNYKIYIFLYEFIINKLINKYNKIFKKGNYVDALEE